jgi:hypothetical protein
MYRGHTREVTIRTVRETSERKDVAVAVEGSPANPSTQLAALNENFTVPDGLPWAHPVCVTGRGLVSPH